MDGALPPRGGSVSTHKSHPQHPKTHPLPLHCHLESFREKSRPQPRPAAALRGPAKGSKKIKQHLQRKTLSQHPANSCFQIQSWGARDLVPFPNYCRDQGEARAMERILPQVGPRGSLLAVPSDPGLAGANHFDISHTSSSASFPPEQKAKQQSSVEPRPAEGSRAQRKGRCRIPAPVKRINSCFRKRRQTDPCAASPGFVPPALGSDGLFLGSVDSELRAKAEPVLWVVHSWPPSSRETSAPNGAEQCRRRGRHPAEDCRGHPGHPGYPLLGKSGNHLGPKQSQGMAARNSQWRRFLQQSQARGRRVRHTWESSRPSLPLCLRAPQSEVLPLHPGGSESRSVLLELCFFWRMLRSPASPTALREL